MRHPGKHISKVSEYQTPALGTDEPFYRKITMAEICSCCENQVLGGKIIGSGNTSDPLFVSKWPSFLTSDDYYPEGGQEKRTASHYVVSFHFIQNTHQQGFRDNVVSGDTTALYIVRLIGIEHSSSDTEALSINSSTTS